MSTTNLKNANTWFPKGHFRPCEWFYLEEHNKQYVLVTRGDWTLNNARLIAKAMRRFLLQIRKDKLRQVNVTMDRLGDLDTIGAMLLLDLIDDLEHFQFPTTQSGLSDRHKLLFDVVSGHPRTAKASPARETSPFLDMIRDLGETVIGIWHDTVQMVAVLGQIVSGFGRTLLQPRRFRVHAFFHQLEHAGLKATPIICLICVLIGAVIMQQGVAQLKYYAADQFAIDLLGVLSLREIGILLTSIMIAGRSGAAFTAEIGSMKMREEIAAMRAIGMSPLDVLVLPRVMAMILILPILTFVGDIMCLVGGGLYAIFALGIDSTIFFERLNGAVTPTHLFVGLIKAPFMGLIISLVGVMEGMRVRGSAESLGRRVRASVVKSIFLVIMFDAFFAIFLSSLGI